MGLDFFLFLNICLTALTFFVIIYSYSLKFFDREWQNRIKQEALVGLTIIFSTMTTFFCWVFYFYFIIFS